MHVGAHPAQGDAHAEAASVLRAAPAVRAARGDAVRVGVACGAAKEQEVARAEEDLVMCSTAPIAPSDYDY